MISWVTPTVDGREESLERSLRYPAGRDDVEVVVIRNEPTCGKAWVAGAHATTGEYVCFSADDLEAWDGFLETMIETVDADFHPAATVMLPDGSKQSCGGMGSDVCRGDCPDWQVVDWSPTPFIRREWWEQHIEPHADMLASLHYSSDCLVSALLAAHGIPSVARRVAIVTHHNNGVGRLWTAGTDHEAFLRYVSQL